MSVDFVLPEPSWFWSTTSPVPGSKIYVPIYLPAKDTLDQFTAYDEDGRRLTMLPTADNGAFAVAGLRPIVGALAARRLAAAELSTVLLTLEDELTKVVMAQKRPDCPSPEEVFAAALRGPLGMVLTKKDETRAVVRDLAGGFLMLVPVTYEPGADRLIKAEWDIPNYWRGTGDRARIRRWIHSGLASVGWVDKRQNIPDLQIGWARSTHVEVVAPEDVELSSVRLEADQCVVENGEEQRVTSERRVFDKPRTTINVAPRIRFSPFEADPELRADMAQELLQARGDKASIEVQFRSPASGVLMAATVASCMLTMLLWVAGEHLASLDRQTYSAVLLVFPAILAAYLLRPGEHAFARRLLVGVRLCGLGVAVCSVAVSALLGVAQLEREMPPESGQPRAGTRALVCNATNAEVGTDRARRSELRSLRCHVGEEIAVRADVNGTVRQWVRAAAWTASALAAMLLFGLLRTLGSSIRSSGRPDVYAESKGASVPSAVQGVEVSGLSDDHGG